VRAAPDKLCFGTSRRRTRPHPLLREGSSETHCGAGSSFPRMRESSPSVKGTLTGFPRARERRAGSSFPRSLSPRKRGAGIQSVGEGYAHWVPACAGTTSVVVIPAHAGIQSVGERYAHWVPACAGTTRVRSLGSRLRGNDARPLNPHRSTLTAHRSLSSANPPAPSAPCRSRYPSTTAETRPDRGPRRR
jgi:hypothetical protein